MGDDGNPFFRTVKEEFPECLASIQQLWGEITCYHGYDKDRQILSKFEIKYSEVPYHFMSFVDDPPLFLGDKCKIEGREVPGYLREGSAIVAVAVSVLYEIRGMVMLCGMMTLFHIHNT